MSPRRYGPSNNLMQVAAAVIGSAAAAQVIVPVDAQRDDDADLVGNAYTNTYETTSAPGVTETPGQLDVVGGNGRRLIARWMPEGVWVGGCLIDDQAAAEALAAFITREASE